MKNFRLQLFTLLALFLFNPFQGQSQNCQAGFVFTTTPANNQVIQFWDSSNVQNVNYFWDFGDNSFGSGMNPVHTYNQSGLYMACLTISDSLNNCTSTYCDTIVVGNPSGSQCSSNFSYSVTPNGVSFSDLSSSTAANGIVSWLWDFGDNQTSTSQNPFHTYGGSGTYNICLTITDSGSPSCTSTSCQSVTIQSGGGCQAEFVATTSGLTASFTDFSMPANSFLNWYWDFGDNTSGSGSNPVHTYTNGGVYSVCLTIVDSLTGCASTYCDSVLVSGTGGSQCQANFSFQDTPMGVMFQDLSSSSSPNGLTSWFWDFGDSTFSTDQSPVHVFVGAGPHSVCLTISDGASPSCSNTICQTFVLNTGGSCQASFSTTTSPNNTMEIQFWDSSSTQNVFYSWDFGDNSFGTGPNPSHVYNQPGFYVACLTISDSNQNCFSTYCDSVFVGNSSNQCNSDFSFSTNPNGTSFSDMSWGSGMSSVVSWMWDFGDSTFSTDQNPFHTYSGSGLYNVCLTITDNGSPACTSTSCQIVNIQSGGGCQAEFVVTTNGLTATFMDFSAPFNANLNWSWDFGDNTMGTGQNPTHTYNADGGYEVCLTIIDSMSGCISTYCDSVLVSSGGANCQASFYSFMDTTGNYTLLVINTATGSNLNYFWDFGDGNSSTDPYPMHTYGGPGVYNLCLTVSNANCQSTYCDSSAVLFRTNGTPYTINIQSGLTSSNEELQFADVRLFPNPSKDVINFTFGNQVNGDLDIKMIDIQGRTLKSLFSGNISSGNDIPSFNISEFNTGMYFLKVELNGVVSTHKFIKN